MKQTLLQIKRQTTLTTKAIAQQAQLETADVFTVEIGGCASWALAQKVLNAFNELSGKHICLEDIQLSGTHVFPSPVKGGGFHAQCQRGLPSPSH